MKPSWDQLMDDFKDSTTALVADVDCTAGGKSLCEKQGVKGYPTIKWGDPNDLQDYKGGRELKDLRQFAQDNLGPTCGPDNLDLCDDESKTSILKFQKMDLDELDMAVEDGDAKIKKIEEKARKEVEKLQSQVSELQSKIASKNTKKDDQIAKESKKMGLKFMKVVLAAKKKKDEL